MWKFEGFYEIDYINKTVGKICKIVLENQCKILKLEQKSGVQGPPGVDGVDGADADINILNNIINNLRNLQTRFTALEERVSNLENP